MKNIICKARRDSFNDKPIWIDPIRKILHSNTRYQKLPECIKKRCIIAEFKDVVHRKETLVTVEYRDTINKKYGPFYIDLTSFKIIAKTDYLKHEFKKECRIATEQEIEDYRYFPVFYYNKYGYDLYSVDKILLVIARHNYKKHGITAGQPFLLNDADLYYWKMRNDYKHDFMIRPATVEEIDQYEFPIEEELE